MQPFLCFSHHIGKTNIMKKLVLISLLLPLFATAQTIPNGNFESWFVVGFLEYPESWETDNTESQTTVTKDLDSYEGELAMRVTAQPTGVIEYGEATALFEISTTPAALNFYAKTELEYGAASVEVTFLNQDTEIYTTDWFSSTSMEDYTLISIPLSIAGPVITHARIKVTTQVGDLIGGSAWISVDAMEFGLPLDVNKTELNAFKVYPNPAHDYLTIQSDEILLGNIKIYDAQGKMVFGKRISDTSAKIDIRNLSSGAYTLRSDNMNVRASKFIVE